MRRSIERRFSSCRTVRGVRRASAPPGSRVRAISGSSTKAMDDDPNATELLMPLPDIEDKAATVQTTSEPGETNIEPEVSRAAPVEDPTRLAQKPEDDDATVLPQKILGRAVIPDDSVSDRDLNPAEQMVSNIKRSRDHLTHLADNLQGIAVKTAIVCGSIMLIGWIYIARPLAAVSAPPADVAKMVTDTKGNNPNNGQSTDIAVYLASLQSLDQQRIGLVNSLAQAMTGQPGSNDTLAQSSQDLVRDFLAKKPPTPCTDFANSYFQLLQDQTAMIAKASAFIKTKDVKDALAAHDAAMPQITTMPRTRKSHSSSFAPHSRPPSHSRLSLSRRGLDLRQIP